MLGSYKQGRVDQSGVSLSIHDGVANVACLGAREVCAARTRTPGTVLAYLEPSTARDYGRVHALVEGQTPERGWVPITSGPVFPAPEAYVAGWLFMELWSMEVLPSGGGL